MRHRDACVRRRGDACRDPWHNAELDPRLTQRKCLLAATPEHEGIAALQPHHLSPGERPLDHQRLRLLLWYRLAAALLTDEQQLGVSARTLQRLSWDQAVVEDRVGARDQLQRTRGQQARVAGACSDEVHTTRR